MKRICTSLLLMIALPASAAEKANYPMTKKIEQVDNYHGTAVPDPYRWLEDDVRTSKDVAEWVEAQNKTTFAYLAAIPQREAMRKRITELWNYEKFSAPSKIAGKYYFSRNNGLQNQAVLLVMDTLGGEPRVVLDPNSWSKDGTVALAGTAFSEDGKYLAYSRADAGSDWNTWKVLDLATMKLLSDELKWVKFSNVSWTPDSKGFYYSRYDEPKKDGTFQNLNLNQKLYFHKLGTPQSDDKLVLARPDHPDWSIGGDVTEDGKYLIVLFRVGTDARHRVAFQDLSVPDGKIVEVVSGFDNEYTPIGNDGSVVYFKTDNAAPRGRVVAIDLDKPEPANWKEIVPQAQENLRGVSYVGNQLVASYLKDAYTQVKIFDVKGRFVREVSFPGIGTAGGFGGKKEETETFYSFSSFATPPSIYRFDMKTGKSEMIRQAKVRFDPADYEVKQVFFKSKDGTKVPMFITARKGIELDGTNPTLLYGYGGFNIPLTPAFSVARLAWLDMGGVFALANLRGGGEYGKTWHKAGTKLTKQNVFDDFIGAAEYLISTGYTSSPKLAIQGGSNGGLLVGACMVQRPELFGACLPAVGVMDMLRFQKFTAGRFWTDDYGSSDNADEFKALFAYSPYHNLKAGTKYPPTMVTTADTDDRVVPGHSFKFAARLQEYHAGTAPVLIRIETRAGHGAGKPTAKIIEELADEYAFLLRELKMTPK